MTYNEWREKYSPYGMFNEAMARAAWNAAVEESAQCSEDTVTALSGLPDVDRLIKLGDDIAFNIRKMKG